MTRDEALSLADRILALVNARPQTPGREEIAELIDGRVWVGPDGYTYYGAKAAAEIKRELQDGCSRIDWEGRPVEGADRGSYVGWAGRPPQLDFQAGAFVCMTRPEPPEGWELVERGPTPPGGTPVIRCRKL